MQAQLQRCKSIVSGILLSAGEARGESSVQTTVSTSSTAWSESGAPRGRWPLPIDNRFGDDSADGFGLGVKQMICNVLDNALEASPRWVALEAAREGDALTLTCRRRPRIRAEACWRSSASPTSRAKGRPGAGSALFLAVHVARTAGGSVTRATGRRAAPGQASPCRCRDTLDGRGDHGR
jgi:two-component system sensor histidine kinase RegB